MRWSISFDIVLFQNRIRLTNLHTGATIERTAIKPFSTDHVLIAERQPAFDLLRELLLQSDKRRIRLFATATVRVSCGPDVYVDRDKIKQIGQELGLSRIDL